MKRVAERIRKSDIIQGFHFYSFGFLRRMYDWTLSWADTKYGAIALFLIAFAESSFFPVPPDILLIALCISMHKKAFRFAAICTAGSVLGGIFGYMIGYGLYETVGKAIILTLGYQEQFIAVGRMYAENGFIAILGAAFTPIPYKVFTIAAGVWKLNIITLVTASLIGRGLRFMIVAALIYYFGARIKTFIDKYFNILAIVFFVLLIGGFIIIKRVI